MKNDPAASDPVLLTQRLVRARSVNPPGDTEAVVAEIAPLLEAAGFRLAPVPTSGGGTSLLAVLPGEGSRAPLCLTGHMDTVPLGNAPWTEDPFGGTVRDGRLYGRGASDMKAGLAAATCAAVALASLERRVADLVLAFTADEEIGCLGARALAESGLLPGRTGALVVAEPTGCRPLLGHKGAFWVRAAFTGKAAHGSMPQHGVNAVDLAIRAVGRLPGLFAPFGPHPLLGAATTNIGTFQGGGKVNMVPDRALLELDMRTLPGMDHAALLAGLRGLWPEASLEVLADVAPVLTAPDHPFVLLALDALESLEGARPDPGTVSFFTDASVLAGALGHPPVLLFGPGESEQAHQTDESCPVEAIPRAASFYRELGARWLRPAP